MEIKEERLQSELQQASISLVIDTYDDIFSDFDPRPYTERALSDDFLLECKRAARDKVEGGFELILSLPKNIRSINDELKVRKRLKEHFRKHALEKEKEVKNFKKQGWRWVGIGSALMLIIAAILFWEYKLPHFLVILSVLLEAPAWFSFWEGLRKILIESQEKQPDYDFYKKMASSQVTFRSY